MIEYLQYLPAIAPWAVVSLIFTYVIKTKANKEVVDLMQKELKETLDEVKVQNGKVHDQVAKQEVQLAEMGRDLKWIRDTIANGGGKDN